MMTGKKRMDALGAGKIIHIASSHQIGLAAQETELAIAYKKLNLFDLLVVTGENEQFEGCFKNLSENDVKNIIIEGFDEHRNFFLLVRRFIEQCNAFQPHVVTLNTNWQILIAGMARIFCEKQFKIVYTIHGFRHNHKAKSYFAQFFIGGLLYIFSDVINAPTRFVANKFRALKNRIVSMPLGEDSIFFNASKPIEIEAKLSIIFPGQFRAGKNQDLLICAVRDYIDQTGDKNVILYLPGSGNLLSGAEQLAQDLGISNYVVFPGQLNRNEILDLYRQCQVAIVPTNSETFGHCIAEPLVLQRILVTKKVGVAIDVVKHGENGLFFESREDLVNRLKEIRKMNFEELKKMSKNAKETGELFRWENIAARHYHEVFKKFF